MSCSRFSIRATYAYAFNHLFSNFWLFFKLILLQLGIAGVFLLTFLFAPLLKSLPKEIFIKGISLTLGSGIIFFIFMSFISQWLFLGYVRACLTMHDYNSYDLNKIWPSLRMVWRSWVAGFIYKLLLVFGLLCLVIPGIIVIVICCVYNWALVDKNLSAWQSLKESMRLTKGCRLKLLLFIVINNLIAFLGAPFLGLGITLSMIATTYVYRRLQSLPMPTLEIDHQNIT